MSNLLVTGGAGFIGSNFVRYWAEAQPADKIVVLDLLTYAGNLQSTASLNGNKNFQMVKGDICDGPLVDRLLRDENIDTVVHFAAESHVDRSIHGPEAFVTTNITGTHTLLAAARGVWEKPGGWGHHRFHHVSTDEVFGSLGADDPPFEETTRYAPNSPYAASKAASDHLVRAYHKTYGFPVTISNCSNNYGPYQFPEKLIPLVLSNILNGKKLPIYGDGLNIRDWLHVLDHCRAIDLIVNQGVLGETYNVGGENEVTNIDLVKTICDQVDLKLQNDPELARCYPESPICSGGTAQGLIEFVRDRAGHDRRYAINGVKIKNELGFSVVETFETGLEKTISWYLDNEDWWRAVQNGSYRNWLSQNYADAKN